MSAHSDDAHHPTEQNYWIIFVVLAVLTALEVAWSYLGLSGLVYTVPLILMMLAKFILVAGGFMHLYFDTKVKSGYIFWLLFAFALAVAIAVYITVFATFEFRI